MIHSKLFRRLRLCQFVGEVMVWGSYGQVMSVISLQLLCYEFNGCGQCVLHCLELVAESETAVEGGPDRAQQDHVDDH